MRRALQWQLRGVVGAALTRQAAAPVRAPAGCTTRLEGTAAARQTVGVTAAVRYAASVPPGSTFKCSECGKAFRLQNALNHHIMTKHAGQGKPIVVGPDGKVIEATAEAAGAAKAPEPATPTPAQPATPQPAPGAFAARPTPAASPSTPAAQPTPAASPAAGAPAAAAAPSAAGQGDSKLFTCTICEKQFRLEAALIHHYQAKHNMEMPGSSAAAPAADAATGDAAANTEAATGPIGTAASGSTSAAQADATATTTAAPQSSAASGHSYVPASETVPPQPPQYHLDVAPNAPEETEIAVHHRCVNHMLLLGAVQDVQQGFVFEDPVTQFILVTDFDGAAPGEPDRDFHTVRVHGERMAKTIREALIGPEQAGEGSTASAATAAGKRVMVSGRLRVVPQYEAKVGKYYHYPVVQVSEGSGWVRVLHDARAEAAPSV